MLLRPFGILPTSWKKSEQINLNEHQEKLADQSQAIVVLECSCICIRAQQTSIQPKDHTIKNNCIGVNPGDRHACSQDPLRYILLRDVVKRHFGGFWFWFNWIWTYFYVCLCYFNMNGFIWVSWTRRPPKYTHDSTLTSKLSSSSFWGQEQFWAVALMVCYINLCNLSGYKFEITITMISIKLVAAIDSFHSYCIANGLWNFRI